MKVDEAIRDRLSSLVAKGEALQAESSFQYVEKYAEWRSQGLVLLGQVFGEDHAYTQSFASLTEDRRRKTSVSSGQGTLRAALDDVQQGHLATLQGMATAEVFTDFLEQADHLLEHGFSAPAASLAGAVLENGLRSLAERNQVPVRARDNLSTLNQKLADKSAYNRLRQKQIEAWIELRNNADHGHFEELGDGDVDDLIKSVRGFLAEML